MTAQASAQPELKPTRLQAIGAALQKAGPRIRDFVVHAVIQIRVLKKAYPAVMHKLIYIGVTIQVVGTIINLLNMLLFFPWVITFPRGTAYLIYELVMDIAGLMILAGVIMAFFRRLVLRPKTLESRWDDYFALSLLALIPLLGFSMEGTRLLATNPAWAAWSPIGNLVSQFFASLGLSPAGATQVHDILFWVHAAVAMLLVASIPFTKMRHLVNIPLHVVFRLSQDRCSR
jgi:nitrate reductase gamma subunit